MTEFAQDGGYRTACVYVPGDSRIDWDDAGDQELVTLIGKYGYNDALTFDDNNVIITDNGETETLIWNSAAMDFTVDVEMFQNGAQNMYFRTVNDGSRDVTMLVDADGKAIMAPELGGYTDVLFTVANNGTEIDTITDGSSISTEAVIQACGGSVNVAALDAGSPVFLLVNGTHVQYCNGDNLTTTPSVAELPPSPFPLKWRNVSWFSYKVLVNSQGAVLTDGTDMIIETGLEAQGDVRVNVAQGAHGAIPSGTSEVMCVITGDIQPGQTGDFTFVYEGQTYNVVDRVCTPEITEIYE